MEAQAPAEMSNTSKIISAIVLTGAVIVGAILWTQGKLDFIPRAFEPDYLKVVRESAVDPDSVQFRRVEGPLNGTVCGEWRGKNRMGAYVEWQPFMARNYGVVQSRWRISNNLTYQECMTRRSSPR